MKEKKSFNNRVKFHAGTHARTCTKITEDSLPQIIQDLSCSCNLHAPATCSRNKAPSSVPTISCKKKLLYNKIFAPEFCSIELNWLNMREQALGANLLRERVAGACCGSKLPRVYRLLRAPQEH